MGAPGANVNQPDLNLVHLLEQAGFKGAGLQTMFRIVMAESGGRANAYNGNAGTGDNSYGLAQINMIGNIGVSRLKQYGLTSYDQLFDPLTNLRAAYKISKGGTNFNAWTTYTSGHYLSHPYDPNYQVNTKPSLNVPNTASSGASIGSTGAGNGSYSPEDYANEVGWSLAVINSSPDLQRIFKQVEAAGPHGWDATRFQGAVEGTDWFRKQSDAQRQWQILSESDPATAKARIAERTQLITQTAAGLGVNLSPTVLAKIVNDSLALGFNDAQIQSDIAKNWTYKPQTASTGLAGASVNSFKQTAADYAVPLSDTAIQDWTQRVLNGNATAQDFTDYAKTQAKSLFPTLTGAIDAGQTVAQYADPYRQIASQTLGVNPDEVNWLDPKWQTAINQVTTDAKGVATRAPMSLSDWTAKIKTDPVYGYDQSAQGRQQGAQLATQIAQMFGNQ